MKKGKMRIKRDSPPDIIEAFIIEKRSNNRKSWDEMMEIRLPTSYYEPHEDKPAPLKEISTVIVIDL